MGRGAGIVAMQPVSAPTSQTPAVSAQAQAQAPPAQMPAPLTSHPAPALVQQAYAQQPQHPQPAAAGPPTPLPGQAAPRDTVQSDFSAHGSVGVDSFPAHHAATYYAHAPHPGAVPVSVSVPPHPVPGQHPHPAQYHPQQYASPMPLHPDSFHPHPMLLPNGAYSVGGGGTPAGGLPPSDRMSINININIGKKKRSGGGGGGSSSASGTPKRGGAVRHSVSPPNPADSTPGPSELLIGQHHLHQQQHQQQHRLSQASSAHHQPQPLHQRRSGADLNIQPLQARPIATPVDDELIMGSNGGGNASPSPSQQQQQQHVIVPPVGAVTTVYVQPCALDTSPPRWTASPPIQGEGTYDGPAGSHRSPSPTGSARLPRCPACGTTPNHGSNFCQNCGWKLFVGSA